MNVYVLCGLGRGRAKGEEEEEEEGRTKGDYNNNNKKQNNNNNCDNDHNNDSNDKIKKKGETKYTQHKVFTIHYSKHSVSRTTWKLKTGTQRERFINDRAKKSTCFHSKLFFRLHVHGPISETSVL